MATSVATPALVPGLTLCSPCLRRNRQVPADRMVEDEPFCRWCFQGGDGPPAVCSRCSRQLRSGNKSTVCGYCSQ